jgi:predicted adenylyl cyclase CyaB
MSHILLIVEVKKLTLHEAEYKEHFRPLCPEMLLDISDVHSHMGGASGAVVTNIQEIHPEIETEVRAQIKNRVLIENKLKSIGAKEIKKVEQTDYYFGNKNLRKTDGKFLLRIRNENSRLILSRKNLTGEKGVWKEEEIEINDFRTALASLKILKFEEVATLIKRRETFKYENLLINIDNVWIYEDEPTYLGTFIEIECKSNAPQKSQIVEFAEKVGLHEHDLIHIGYLPLALQMLERTDYLDLE